jgi:hypothetical protein
MGWKEDKRKLESEGYKVFGGKGDEEGWKEAVKALNINDPLLKKCAIRGKPKPDGCWWEHILGREAIQAIAEALQKNSIVQHLDLSCMYILFHSLFSLVLILIYFERE